MSAAISRDEWLKALAEASIDDAQDDRDALTIEEFAAMFDLPRQTAAHRLEKLEAIGRAVRTSKRGVSPYGRRIRYVAYRLVPSAPKAKRR